MGGGARPRKAAAHALHPPLDPDLVVAGPASAPPTRTLTSTPDREHAAPAGNRAKPVKRAF